MPSQERTAATASPHLALLRAVDNAAFEGESADGWATAREVRIAFDGCPNPQGIWARKLWAAQDAGLLESVPFAGHPGSRLWGLTDAGATALAEAEAHV